MPKRLYAKNRIDNPSPKPRPIPLYNRILPEIDKRGTARGRTMTEQNPEKVEIDGRLVAHNVLIAGHRTSVRMEAVMWHGLNEICRRERVTVNELVTKLNEKRHPNASMTGTIRSFMVEYFWYKAKHPATQGDAGAEVAKLLDILQNTTFKA